MMDSRTTSGYHFLVGSAVPDTEVEARITAVIACIALSSTGTIEEAPTFGEIKETLRPLAEMGIISSINGLALFNNDDHKEIEALIRSNDEALSLVLGALAARLVRHQRTAGAGRAIKNRIAARGVLFGSIFDTQDQYVIGILQYYGLRIPIHDDWDHALVYHFLLNLSYNREHIEDDDMLRHYVDMADACVRTKNYWSVVNCFSESRIRTSALIAREHPLEAGGVDGAAILDHLAEELQDELGYSTVSDEKSNQYVVEKTITAIVEGPLRGVPASTTAVLGIDALVPDIRSFLTATIDAEAQEGTVTTGIPSVSFHSSRFRESMLRVGQSAIVTASAVEATTGPFTIPIAGIGTENQRIRDMDALLRMGFAEVVPFDAAAVASAWSDKDKDDEGAIAAMAAALASSLDDVVEREEASSGRAASQWHWVATRISGMIEDGLSPERAVLESASHYFTDLRGVINTDEYYYYNDNRIVNVPQCMKIVHKAAAEICGAEPGRLTLLTRKGVHSIFLHQAALDVHKEVRWSHGSGIVEEDDGPAYILHVNPNGEYEERFLEKGGFTCMFYEPDGDGAVVSRTVRG